MDTVHAQGTRDLIDVFIVAAVRLYQQGLARALSDDRRCRVVGAAGNHEVALERIFPMRPLPAGALIDVAADPGLEGARLLNAGLTGVAVVAVAVADTDEDAIACAETGVAGFVTRDTSLDGLIATVKCVAQEMGGLAKLVFSGGPTGTLRPGASAAW